MPLSITIYINFNGKKQELARYEGSAAPGIGEEIALQHFTPTRFVRVDRVRHGLRMHKEHTIELWCVVVNRYGVQLLATAEVLEEWDISEKHLAWELE
jgi:hypothetical protein